jgi:DNA-3-methyladenine glycosylase I
MARSRCSWVPEQDPLYVAYHDEEWGVPSHDDRHLFELLSLEGAQAGLSWSTILRKREGYRKAFADFDIATVARFDADDVSSLLLEPAIVRNRRKIESVVTNAAAAAAVKDEFETIDAYLWQFVGGKPIRNRWRSLEDVPAVTTESQAMSRDLKRRGFRFVGPTVCYAFMQAAGFVNDHVTSCFRYREISELA